jgi:hypothetical protein
MELVGRHRECAALDRLIEAVCAGESRALVVARPPCSTIWLGKLRDVASSAQ